jgi:hypothetical protein
MSATANGCGNAVDIQPATASGVNSTAVSSPTVFNYPVQPADDTGRMMALASIIGGLFDALLGGDALDDAEDAQNTWKSILDNTMTPRGQSELARVDTERAKMAPFETDLSNQLPDYRNKADAQYGKLSPFETDSNAQRLDYRGKADGHFSQTDGHDTDLDGHRDANRTDATEYWGKRTPFETDLATALAEYRARADIMWGKLDPMDTKIQEEIDEQRQKSDDEFDYSNITCLDDAIDKLCEYVGCGYTPDYTGIATRARADAEIQAMKAYQEACRTGNRYNTRRTQSSLLDIRLATRSAALVATAGAREKERQYAFDTNLKMRFDHAKHLEDVRLKRRELSIKYDEMAMRALTERWKSFAELMLVKDKRADDIATERWQNYVKLHMDKDGVATSISTERWKSMWTAFMEEDRAADKLSADDWQRFAKLYLDLEKGGDGISTERWKAFSAEAFKSYELGGSMLAASMQAYQAFAASVRATAKQSGGGGGLAGLLAQLAAVVTMFSGDCSKKSILGIDFYPRPQNCCAPAASSGAGAGTGNAM